MQSLERIRVHGWGDLPGCHRFVVSPQRDGEAITLIDARLRPGVQSSHRALGFGEPPGQPDLELCDLMRYWRERATMSQGSRRTVSLFES